MAPSKKCKRLPTPDAPSIRFPHNDTPPPIGWSLRPRTVAPTTARTNVRVVTPAAASAAAPTTFKAINVANPSPSAAAPATPKAYGSPSAATTTTPRAYSPPSAAATPRTGGSGSTAVTPGVGSPLSAAVATASPSTASPPAAAAAAWNPLQDLPLFEKKVSAAFVAFSRHPAIR